MDRLIREIKQKSPIVELMPELALQLVLKDFLKMQGWDEDYAIKQSAKIVSWLEYFAHHAPGECFRDIWAFSRFSGHNWEKFCRGATRVYGKKLD
jgi:hypothetical protein